MHLDVFYSSIVITWIVFLNVNMSMSCVMSMLLLILSLS